VAIEQQPAPSEYARRLERWRIQRQTLEQTELGWSLTRVALFVGAIALSWQAFSVRSVHGGWLLVPLVLFLLAMTAHDRVIRRRRQAQRAETYYRKGIARLEGHWAEQGDDGARFRDDSHPYASDLDLFGGGSLFQRLNQARSEIGKRRLVDWLRDSETVATIQRRQEAVRELAAAHDIRESLAIVGEDVEGPVDLVGLERWLADRSPPRRGLAWAAAILALSNVLTLAYWWSPLIDGVQPLEKFWEMSPAFLLSAFASLLVAVVHLRRTRQILGGVGQPAMLLELFTALLTRIEEQTFTAPRLRELQSRLAVAKGTGSASRAIRHLRLLVEVEESRSNMILSGLGGLTLLGTQLALGMERWRCRHGGDVLGWLDTLAEFEATASLATYRFERPDDTFPELREDGPHYEAQELGHPLIDPSVCVRNDLMLGSEHRLYLVSGSNMSGKSTWLRSAGINAVLALCGAPVCARRMTISPLRVGASMRTIDSLQAGLSHFYAEIKRLRFLVDLTAGDQPVLFLLDEILHGTNSHDRRIGADALVRGLVEKGAIGLVTTHDLALAQIATALAPRARNVHFADRLEDDRVVFDYRLRDGVVDHSNALALMRAIGLEV